MDSTDMTNDRSDADEVGTEIDADVSGTDGECADPVGDNDGADVSDAAESEHDARAAFSALISDKRLRAALKYALAFLVPLLTMLFIYRELEFYPFGEKSLLTADMYGQYTCFISYFKDMWKNGSDLFYTFSKSLGGDMFGFAAYYLLSPFNLIAFFFDTRDLPQAMMLITLLKVGCAGLTFYILARREMSRKPGAILFSTAYALMSFMFVYQQNILWLDAVIGLPIVALGIRRLVKEGKPILYAVSLGICLAVNYYTGYILCLFSVLFFIYTLIAESDFGGRRGVIASFAASVRFGVFSLIAAGLSSAVLLPTILSLRGGEKNTSAMQNLTLDPLFRIPDFFTRLFSGSFENGDLWYTTLPTVFCGMFALVMAILFFMNVRLRRRERAAGALLLAILTVCLQLRGLYLLWHGFNYPVGFPYRHAFVFSFTVLFIGCRCFAHSDGISTGKIAAALAAVCAFAVIAGTANKNVPQASTVWGEIFLAAAFAALIAFISSYPGIGDKPKKLLILGALLLSVSELMQNGAYVLNNINYYTQEDYTSYIDDVEPLIERIKSGDGDFYRIEKTFQRDHNDPMLLSYRGLSHFSSTEKNATKKFLERLGLRNNGNWVYYNHGSTIAADSILGVRYLLAKEKPNDYYEPLYTENGITVYKNPYALPLGFAVSGTGVDAVIAGATDGNPFEFQNNVLSAMSGCGDIFIKANGVETELSGLEYASPGKYVKTGSGTGIAEFTFTAERSDPLYVFMPADMLKTAQINVNGRYLGTYFSTRRYDVVYLGTFEPGEKITFTVRASEDEIYWNGAHFYYQDMEKTKDAAESLASTAYEIEKFTSSHIKGSVTVDEGRTRLLTTIPADDGWTAFVDGKKTEPTKVFDALWSLELTPGTHTVEWRYVPRGLVPGIAVTVFSAFALTVFGVTERRRRMTPSADAADDPPENGAEG